MGHQLAYHAAVDGKPPVSRTSPTSELFANTRRLTFAAAAFFMTSLATPASYAQSSGPYAGMAGNWHGGGTVTLDDGSNERIRCRATYQVSGPNMEMSLTCASDAYRFNLTANVVDQGGAISGQWSETSRGITGSLQGKGGGGNRVYATTTIERPAARGHMAVAENASPANGQTRSPLMPWPVLASPAVRQSS
jgi:hypothetical protein